MVLLARHRPQDPGLLTATSPLRVLRFVLGKGRREPAVEVVQPNGGLSDVLDRNGRRLDVRLGSAPGELLPENRAVTAATL